MEIPPVPLLPAPLLFKPALPFPGTDDPLPEPAPLPDVKPVPVAAVFPEPPPIAGLAFFPAPPVLSLPALLPLFGCETLALALVGAASVDLPSLSAGDF